MIDTAITEIEPLVGTLAACRALGASRAALYRRRSPAPVRARRPRPAPARALSDQERAAVLEQLNSPRFVNASPAEVYATLLDEGRYLASQRTMYRLLSAASPVRDRRDQLTHPPYKRPKAPGRGAQRGLVVETSPSCSVPQSGPTSTSTRSSTSTAAT